MMVSLNGAAAGANEEAQGALITSQDQQRRPYKSYRFAAELTISEDFQWCLAYRYDRKKYRKLRMDFEASMDEAVELFDAEQKARDTAQRLQEQNEYSILLANHKTTLMTVLQPNTGDTTRPQFEQLNHAPLQSLLASPDSHDSRL